jgi:hypothetical protein
MNATSLRRTISTAMRTDKAKHEKNLQRFNEGILIHVTREGQVTFPHGKDLWDALSNADSRLSAEYNHRREQNRLENLQFATASAIKARYSEEDLDLVRASVFFSTWEARLSYLQCLGYTGLIVVDLQRRLKELKRSGDWLDLVRMANE